MDTQRLKIGPEISKTQVIDLFPVSSSNIAADSHPGFIRSQNEDSYAYDINKAHRNSILIVADGVGGYEGGEFASRYTAQSIIGEWRKFACNQLTAADVGEFLRIQIDRVNREIFLRNCSSCRLDSPMGTTIAVLCLLPTKIVWASAGDSRIYRIRKNMIQQITEDHSHVKQLLRANKITPEQAKNSPFAHVIYKSIGAEKNLIPDIGADNRLNGDKFILCSDGLTDDVGDETILNRVQNSSCAKDTVQALIADALSKGGSDNVTILCYHQR